MNSIRQAYPGIHTPICRKTFKSIRIQKLRKSGYKVNIFWVSRKTVQGNVVKNCMESFIELGWLKRDLKSGELKVLLRSRRYYLWSDFGIFLSRENRIFSNFEMRFSVTFLYFSEESINNSGKRLLHWKALVGSCRIYSHASGAT